MKHLKKILGFCAYSGTGKTTLIKQIIPALTAQQLKIGVIKHAHHAFDTDQPGKDSYELRKAGAKQMLVSSSQRSALITELFGKEPEPDLQNLICQLNEKQLDLILVEGFKHESFPKIELHRRALGKPYIYPEDKNVIALATDQIPTTDISIPVLDLNDINAIADFIKQYYGIK